MVKHLFATLVAGAALLAGASCVSHRPTLEIRPASGEEVELRIRGGNGLQFRARANGLSTNAGRVVNFVAPGFLEITGGAGELELSTTDTAQRFLLIAKGEVAGVTREIETRGQRAVIRMRDGEMKIEGEAMIMRERRAP